MKLHWSPRSPYVRKVMIVAHELGLTERIETVRTVVGGTVVHRELMQENPLGKIPALVLEDGTVLFDSPVICEYLDWLAGGRLFPASWPARGEALRRLALGDGMLDTALLWLGERRRPRECQSQDHIAMWRAKLTACVDALEREAGALADKPFTIGQIGLGVALGYLDFRFGDLQWREGHPDLAAWQSGFDDRASVRATLWVDDS